MENNKNYEIGYGKPPKNTRFTKGRSGNPAGRKKKVIPETLFQAISLELCQQKTITNASGLKEKVPLYSILAKKWFKMRFKMTVSQGNSYFNQIICLNVISTIS